jgi:hypothetical protein
MDIPFNMLVIPDREGAEPMTYGVPETTLEIEVLPTLLPAFTETEYPSEFVKFAKVICVAVVFPSVNVIPPSSE